MPVQSIEFWDKSKTFSWMLVLLNWRFPVNEKFLFNIYVELGQHRFGVILFHHLASIAFYITGTLRKIFSSWKNFKCFKYKICLISFSDCHAEIISRRCLCEFLYRQLELFSVNPVESIFMPRDDGRGYKLKVNIVCFFKRSFYTWTVAFYI
jgi:hypothetical protein